MDRDTARPSVEQFPGPLAREWVDYHRSNAATSTHVFDVVWDVEADASGPFFTDVDGNVLMDFTSQVAASPLGFNNPEILSRMGELDLTIDPLKFAGSAFYVGTGTEPADSEFPGPSSLMDRLTALVGHYDMDAVFLSNSGAEAVENAIKICYANGGHRGVTFDGAFHGRTLGALTLNRSKAVHRKGYPEAPGVISVPYCTCRGECACGWKTNGPGGNALADKLDPGRGVIDPDELSYLILESVQGEGGYRIPNDEFVADIAEIRETYDVLVIADEIQTGLGRTGEMWGVDHLDLTPDVITSAKGLRVGATISRTDVFPEEPSRIASTWSGGDIANAVQGALTLDVISDGLLSNVRTRGEQFLETMADRVPETVVDVRGRGLMLAVEFDTKERRDAVHETAAANGLLTLGCGYKTLRVLPPLDATEREIELGADLLGAAIEAES